MPRTLASILIVLGLAGAMNLTLADDAHDHHAIAKVMKELHKGKDSIASRAMEGKASKDEIAKLAAGYTTMLATEPHKGDAAEWKKRVEALLAATEKLAAEAADAPTAYKQAVNCKACHTAHRED